MISEGVFSGRLLAIWITASVVLLGVSLYLMLAPEGTTPGIDEVGPSVFSRSAIGHAGIAMILQRLGMRVVKSRYGSLGRLDEEDLLVIAEPQGASGIQDSMPLDLHADRTLLILPKRAGIPSQDHPGWIADANLRDEAEIQALLTTNDIDATIAYAREPVTWKQNMLGVAPEIAAPVQLIQSDTMQPLVASDRGALVALFQRGRHKLWVLADPDVLENHGLARAANAAFAVTLLQGLTGPGGRIIFDETIHGYASSTASPLKLLVTFPYVLATAQAILAIGLLLWATVGRFGKAEPMAPALAAGKLGLIGNIAELMGFAGHHDAVVRRYVQEALRDAGRLLHAPALPDGELVGWLSRMGRLRGVKLDCADIVGRLEETRARGRGQPLVLMALARDTYRWRRGIVDGQPGDPRARGGHSRRNP